MKRAAWLAAAGLLLAIGLLAWTGRREAGPALGVADSKGGMRVLLAAAGELDRLPYALHWADFSSAADALHALDARAVDIAPSGDAPFVVARAQGSEGRIIAAWRSGVQDTAILALRGAPLAEPRDLRGRAICTTRGSTGHFLLLRTLDRLAIPADAVRQVFMSPPDCRAALESGSIAAWATWGLFADGAELDGTTKVVRDGTGLSTGLGMIVARPETIAAKQPLIADFIARLGRARRWALAHPDAFARAVADDTRVPYPVVRLYVRRQSTRMVPLSTEVMADLRLCIAIYHSAGLLPQVPDLGQAIDPRFDGGRI